jgi:hypothetical protein
MSVLIYASDGLRLAAMLRRLEGVEKLQVDMILESRRVL